MTWPKRYGGGERSMLERYLVNEELPAADAPVGSRPYCCPYGTEEQRLALLPGVARGEVLFCIGMSEPGRRRRRRTRIRCTACTV